VIVTERLADLEELATRYIDAITSLEGCRPPLVRSTRRSTLYSAAIAFSSDNTLSRAAEGSMRRTTSIAERTASSWPPMSCV
jgi:hypothetical protein